MSPSSMYCRVGCACLIMAVLRKSSRSEASCYRAQLKVKRLLQQMEMITVPDKTALIVMHDARFDVFATMVMNIHIFWDLNTVYR
jgi:hypothetical protein